MLFLCIPGPFVQEGYSGEEFQDEAFPGAGIASGAGDFNSAGLKFVPESKRNRRPGAGLNNGVGSGGSLPSTPRVSFEESKKKRREDMELKQRDARIAREMVRLSY